MKKLLIVWITLFSVTLHSHIIGFGSSFLSSDFELGYGVEYQLDNLIFDTSLTFSVNWFPVASPIGLAESLDAFTNTAIYLYYKPSYLIFNDIQGFIGVGYDDFQDAHNGGIDSHYDIDPTTSLCVGLDYDIESSPFRVSLIYFIRSFSFTEWNNLFGTYNVGSSGSVNINSLTMQFGVKF